MMKDATKDRPTIGQYVPTLPVVEIIKSIGAELRAVLNEEFGSDLGSIASYDDAFRARIAERGFAIVAKHVPALQREVPAVAHLSVEEFFTLPMRELSRACGNATGIPVCIVMFVQLAVYTVLHEASL